MRKIIVDGNNNYVDMKEKRFSVGIFEKGETRSYSNWSSTLKDLEDIQNCYPKYHWVISNDHDFIFETMEGKNDKEDSDVEEEEDMTFEEAFDCLTKGLKMSSSEALLCIANSKANIKSKPYAIKKHIIEHDPLNN